MILERLRYGLNVLELFEGVGVEAFLKRPPNNTWSAHEDLAHLGRYHEIFLERIERILKEDAPQFSRYRADDDQGFLQWVALSTEDVIGEMRVAREHLLRRLETLSKDDFARVGIHPLYGRLTIEQWLEFFLAHEGHHLYIALLRSRS
jgi:uncharacterized damage-inducible protein DinB